MRLVAAILLAPVVTAACFAVVKIAWWAVGLEVG